MHLTSNVLQKCALFKNISGQEITTLLSAVCCKEEAFAEKSIIFSPIQKADRMGIILKGAVDIQKVFPTGKIVIIKRKRTADILAGIEMFSSYGYYTETLVACKPCTLLLIPQKDLLTLLGLDHRISLNFLEYAANSALVLKNKIGILSLDSIQAKIAGHLVHDHKINGALEITLPFSKKEWAEYLDVSRTSLSRELRGLEREGILLFNKRSIRIKDLSKLEKILTL